MAQRKYLVYSFQYREMKKPKIDAKFFKDESVWDTLPPTLIKSAFVNANNKKEAIDKVKNRLLKIKMGSTTLSIVQPLVSAPHIKEVLTTKIKTFKEELNKDRLRLLAYSQTQEYMSIALNKFKQVNDGLVNIIEDIERIYSIFQSSEVSTFKIKSKGKLREFLVFKRRYDKQNGKKKYIFNFFETTKGIRESDRIRYEEIGNNFIKIRNEMFSIFRLK